MPLLAPVTIATRSCNCPVIKFFLDVFTRVVRIERAPSSHYLFIIAAQLASSPQKGPMSEVTYEIVQHDGGWAYKSDGVFSEPYPTHAAALQAAKLAAAEQKEPGREAVIEFRRREGPVAHRNRSRR